MLDIQTGSQDEEAAASPVCFKCEGNQARTSPHAFQGEDTFQGQPASIPSRAGRVVVLPRYGPATPSTIVSGKAPVPVSRDAAGGTVLHAAIKHSGMAKPRWACMKAGEIKGSLRVYYLCQSCKADERGAPQGKHLASGSWTLNELVTATCQLARGSAGEAMRRESHRQRHLRASLQGWGCGSPSFCSTPCRREFQARRPSVKNPEAGCRPQVPVAR